MHPRVIPLVSYHRPELHIPVKIVDRVVGHCALNSAIYLAEVVLVTVHLVEFVRALLEF